MRRIFILLLALSMTSCGFSNYPGYTNIPENVAVGSGASDFTLGSGKCLVMEGGAQQCPGSTDGYIKYTDSAGTAGLVLQYNSANLHLRNLAESADLNLIASSGIFRGPVYNDATKLDLGAACTSSHGLSLSDVCIFADAEVNGVFYADGNTVFGFGAQFNDNILANFGSSSDASIRYNTNQTPDTLWVGTSTDSNVVLITERGDGSTDFAYAQQTNPTLVLQSAAEGTPAQRLTLAHDQTDGVITAETGKVNLAGTGVMLADQDFDLVAVAGVATAFAKINVASGTHISGQMHYALHADDATDYQVRSGVTNFAAANKAGTITCAFGTVPANFAAIVNTAGTTTLAFTCSDAGSNVLDLEANATSTLTETTLELHYSIILNEDMVITPQ